MLPSLSEGFSNTVLESMSAGKPLVVTDVGGNSEAVIHGKTGFIVPPQNINKLADAILLLLADKKMAKRMGEEGRKKAIQFFSIETMIEKKSSQLFTGLWIADYPDPDTFFRVGLPWLQIGWHNETFDRLVHRARGTIVQSERLNLFAQADRIMANEVPFIPMIYLWLHWLLKPWLKRCKKDT